MWCWERNGGGFCGRRLPGYFAAFLLCIGCACLSQAQSAPSIPSRLQSREVIEAHLKAFSTKNYERETLIRNWLSEADCAAANLSEQALERKLPPNVICVLPGKSKRVILVGAHTDHVDSFGDGVVDNWTGAILLPALLYSLSAQPRGHTFVFVGFSGEEKGLVGSHYYADHLTVAQRSNIDAVVNFDSLGLGPTKVWASHADKFLVDELMRVAKSGNLPLSVMNPENGASADSESFAPYRVPRVTLHSVTMQTWSMLHSPRDKLAAVKLDDLYDSYKLIMDYLVHLDGTLTCCASHQ